MARQAGLIDVTRSERPLLGNWSGQRRDERTVLTCRRGFVAILASSNGSGVVEPGVGRWTEKRKSPADQQFAQNLRKHEGPRETSGFGILPPTH
jgi:hypothetical protein